MATYSVIISSLEMLRRVGCFDTGVSGLRIGPIFKGHALLKRLCQTNLRCVTTQKTENSDKSQWKHMALHT